MLSPASDGTPAPGAFRLFAAWMDVHDAENGFTGKQVQDDFRRWANELEGVERFCKLCKRPMVPPDTGLPPHGAEDCGGDCRGCMEDIEGQGKAVIGTSILSPSKWEDRLERSSGHILSDNE